jgi:tRNA(Ile)-lysidine synthase
LTAHHAEDQAETVLLQLLRGAGLKGLGAMPICRPWAAGWHLRPLLSVAQRELTEFGRAALGRAALGRAAPGRAAPGRAEFGPAEGVTAVSDPMNADLRFDRVYLRRQLWPLLEQRWPGAAAALSRTARHCADAQELLDESAAHAVQKLRDGSALSVTGLRALSPAQRDLALRFWLAEQSIDAPGSARLREAVRQMIAAQADHLPAVVWARHALRRYRDRVFLTAAELPRIGQAREWPIAPGAALELGGGLGTLRWSPQDGGLDARRLPPALVMRQRRGGERLRPQPRARTQTLQHLCQAMGVLPWMRDALPLLYAGNELIAVGDLWQDARWCVAAGQPGFGCEWLGGPLLM